MIIADGIRSKSYEEVPIDGVHFKSVKIANDILHSDVFIRTVPSHRSWGERLPARHQEHRNGKCQPQRQAESALRCKAADSKAHVPGCGLCIKWCPVNAISMVEGKAYIDESICYGCAERRCHVPIRCSEGQWGGTSRSLEEKMAEYAWGAIKDKRDKVACFNFIIHVTKECDCAGKAQPAVIRDVGILASYDHQRQLIRATVDLIAGNGQEGHIQGHVARE